MPVLGLWRTVMTNCNPITSPFIIAKNLRMIGYGFANDVSAYSAKPTDICDSDRKISFPKANRG